MSERYSTSDELLVNKECLNGLEILKEHNLVFLCPPTDTDEIFNIDTCAAVEQETCGKYPSSELVTSWSNKVQFDSDGHVTSLDLGGKMLHKGLPCDPQVFGDQYFSRLQTFSLAGTNLPIAYMVAILPFIQSRIECLYLGGNSLGVNGAEQISSCLRMFKRLVKLDLRYNDMGAEAMTAISQALVNTNIQHLYLEGNNIGDAGCIALVDFLLKKDNSQIKELFLGSNQIDSSGAKSLASSLWGNKNISKIYLEGNNIGINGAKEFCSVLEELNGKTGLRNLFVDNNNIGKEMSKRLAASLKSGTTIQDPLV